MTEPAHRWIPEYRETLGPEVADICAMAGFPPDPEQQLALDAIFALRPDGKSVLFETAVVVPRQNMKTGLFKQCALGWLFVTKQRLIIWSAHEFSTSQEAHRDLKELLEGCPQLLKRVKAIPSGNGDEGIELHGGQRVKFRARTKTGGRGLTGDKIVLDEAFALQPTHIGSLMPTLSVVPDAQIVYGSSAGLATSDVLRRIRDRGRAGGDPRLGYLEWCDDLPGECELGDECTHAVGSPNCRMDDRRRWFRANPQLARRLPLERMESFRKAMPPEEFGREEMGWWDEPPTSGAELALDPDRFAASMDAASVPDGPVVLGLDVAPDRTTSLCAAGWRADGRKHVEVIRTAPGTGWAIDVLLQVVERHDPTALVLDERVVGLLGVQLRAARIEPMVMNGSQLAQACMGLADDVIEDRLRWRGDAPLAAAAGSASWRAIGDGKAFDRKGGAGISPLVGCAAADWGLETFGRPKPTGPAHQPESIPAESSPTSAGFDPATAGF